MTDIEPLTLADHVDPTPEEIRQAQIERLSKLGRGSWSGYLCRDTAQGIFNRLVGLLVGQPYTMVSTMENRLAPTDIRVNQRLTAEPKLHGGDHVGMTFSDGRYVWGLHAGTVQTEVEARTAPQFYQAFVTFSYDGIAGASRVEISQYNGYGKKLHWTIIVEDERASMSERVDAVEKRLRDLPEQEATTGRDFGRALAHASRTVLESPEWQALRAAAPEKR